MDKQLGYEGHAGGDESHELAFEKTWTVALFLATGAYAMYRIVQTNILAVITGNQFTVLQRTLLSVADASLMAAIVPIAIWATKRFPVWAPRRAQHLMIHAVIGLVSAGAWIVGLIGISFVVTGVEPRDTFIAVDLSWVTSNIFAYAALVASVHAMMLQQRLRERSVQAIRLHAQLSSARLEALKAQLHPHFLFNTLHTISELIYLDPPAADAMVVRLSKLLRQSIDTSADHEIRLGRELETVTDYLELQRMRHGDRLRIEFDVDQSLLDGLVPPLILQPLVENSLRHGIGPRSAPGTIRVSAARAGHRLALAVSDDGVGLPTMFEEGIGLRNTRSRLRELYDDDHLFSVNSVPTGGTIVRVELPLHRKLVQPIGD